MARRANSLLNSLKGKIWLATTALAFFVCVFGVFSYLLASFVVSETFYAVLIPFLFVSFTVMVFGWWLSNEVVSPIEKVGLLAKSLERSPLTSLPKTTGTLETDEILQTLHRNSQQLQNIVGLMDDVAGGKMDVALTPLQNSDRLSSSFQKLLARVSDSIHAKQDLEKLEAAIEQIGAEIALVRKGNLSAVITADAPQTREISETLGFLINHLNTLIAQTGRDSRQAQTAAEEARRKIQTVIRNEELNKTEMNRTAQTLKKMPSGVQKISEELSGSIRSANQSIEKARTGAAAAQENLNSVSSLRKQLHEAILRIQRLNERSDEITKIAKAIGDLAHRTNLIALNASIQAAETSEKRNGFAILAEEVERLSARAENTNKEISSLNKSITVEIGDVENSLQTIVRDSAALSKFSVETGNTLSELERYVGQFLNLQTKLADYSREQALESEKSIQIFADSVSVTDRTVDDLKDSEANLAALSALMKEMHSAAAGFTPAETLEPEAFKPEEIAGAAEFGDFAESFEPPPALQALEEKV